MHLVHASSFSVYNARIRKSHQEHAAEHKEGRTCTAGVGQLRSGRVGEQYEVANTRSYRADYRLRLVCGAVINLVADFKAFSARFLNCVLGPVLQVVDDHVLVGLELEGALALSQERAFDALALRVIADNRIIGVLNHSFS